MSIFFSGWEKQEEGTRVVCVCSSGKGGRNQSDKSQKKGKHEKKLRTIPHALALRLNIF